MSGELTLYVWPQFAPDYTDGLAFAIAETMQEAIELVKAEYPYTDDFGPVSEYSTHRKVAFARHGGG